MTRARLGWGAFLGFAVIVWAFCLLFLITGILEIQSAELHRLNAYISFGIGGLVFEGAVS
jgi:hypothetical protein